MTQRKLHIKLKERVFAWKTPYSICEQFSLIMEVFTTPNTLKGPTIVIGKHLGNSKPLTEIGPEGPIQRL